MARIQKKGNSDVYIKVKTTIYKKELQTLMKEFSEYLSFDSNDMANFTRERNKNILNNMLNFEVINFACCLKYDNETVFFIRDGKILNYSINDYNTNKE